MTPAGWVSLFVGIGVFIFAPRLVAARLRGPVTRSLRPVLEEYGVLFLRAIGGIAVGSSVMDPRLGTLLGICVAAIATWFMRERDHAVLETGRDEDDDVRPQLPT